MKQRYIAILSTWLSVLGCTTERPASDRGSELEPPSITVKLEGPGELMTESAAVQTVPAPDIEFLALVRPDRNHFVAVSAPISGVLVRIQPERHTHRGDTLGVVGVGSQIVGREIAVVGAEDGTWLPLRRPTQFVPQEDTLGVIEKHGFWLALGSITDVEALLVHQGDPTSLRLGSDRHAARRPGKVEWVRKGADSPYSADVAVEFRAPEGAFDSQPGPVTVTVTSEDPEDSVPAVPASAVVHLAPGAAVFVPLGLGRYEVRWVPTGPPQHGVIVVREGLRSGMSVVVRGLAALVDAAQDSLAARADGRRH